MNDNWPEWLADGLSWGTHCVGSYVPAGFERYGRIEHRDFWSDDSLVYYLHGAQFGALTRALVSDGTVWEPVWALFWEGIDGDRPVVFEGRYSLHLSTVCEVYRTNVGELVELCSRTDSDSLGFTSPALWFNDMRTWCVATPPYWPCTFVGGSTSLFERMQVESLLRPFEQKWSTGFTDL